MNYLSNQLTSGAEFGGVKNSFAEIPLVWKTKSKQFFVTSFKIAGQDCYLWINKCYPLNPSDYQAVGGDVLCNKNSA